MTSGFMSNSTEPRKTSARICGPCEKAVTDLAVKNAVEQDAETASMSVISSPLGPANSGAGSAAVQAEGTARAARTKSGLFAVSRSSDDVSHGALPMSPASETEQRVRQRAAYEVRYFYPPYMFELSDVGPLAARNGFRA